MRLASLGFSLMFQKVTIGSQGIAFNTKDDINCKREGTSRITLFIFFPRAIRQAVGSLASELSSNIDNEEIICFGAYEEESLIASIFFTHLRFNDGILVYMLAPVAVSTEHQGKGVGQALIQYGLNELKNRFWCTSNDGNPPSNNAPKFRPLRNIIRLVTLPRCQRLARPVA